MTILAGVDGCPAGWIAALRDLDRGTVTLRVVVEIAHLFDRADAPAIVAVDMPIGLPDQVGPGGRPPERAVRPLLGPRQSSVFSVPARSAVEAADYGSACAAALLASDPPRRVSRQCFHLFPKILEIDALLRDRPDLVSRLFETHPEVAFAVLSGAPMALPKKVKSAANPPGLDERRAFLAGRGLPADLLGARPPRGAGADDVIDACVSLLVADRLQAGLARPFPPEDHRDRLGVRMAIWA